MAKTKWLGKADTCDICKVQLKQLQARIRQWFVDGRVVGGSAWALMCPTCFDTYGVGLGTGKGQKYDFETKEKIEG